MDQARLKYRIVGVVVLVALAAILVPVLNDMRQPLPLGPQAIDIPPEPTDGVAGQLPADGGSQAGVLPEPHDIPAPAPPPPTEGDGVVPPLGRGTDLAPAVPAAPPQAKPSVPVARPAPASTPRAPAPAPVAKPAPAPTPELASKPPVAKPAPAPAPKPVSVAKPVPASAPAAIPAAKPAAPTPAPAASASTAAAPTTGQAWVVQLGVFGNLKTAIDLREQLRKAGHSAFTEEVTTPQGKALRVRVGPELDRATAQAVRDRLARETGHDGIVVAYP
ncbi:SPOR domain-containing protein [Immundisolibacter sp.]